MIRFTFFAAILSLSCFADSPETIETCEDGKRPYRAIVRHIEGGGIGYEDGYTTIETFFASNPSQWIVTPFLDLRGHIFNNGKLAANAGMGLRTLWGNRVYGINTYYDYRNVGRFNSNQVGIGLETLGALFDFRINGYLPVGTKTSDPYDPIFANFSGNSMFISQKYQSAMKGANAEFAFHFGKTKLFNFYAAAGPYYFVGNPAPATWGGKGRISGTFKDIITLEISDSYDTTFHNKFQGQISLNYAFGAKSKVKKQGRTCKVANTLNSRMLQQADRQEIIVIDKLRKNSAAIDPLTGLPYFFVFVDNTSHSNGTYESPYHTFAQVENYSSPNDVIYVFPGDGTATGMNSGITLKAYQKLWGSGINHSIQTSVGTISIPSQTSSSPIITNTNSDTVGDAIILDAHNAISGFTIASTLNNAIYGTDPQTLEVSSCTFENNGLYVVQASFPGDASISLTNNQFINNTNGIIVTFNGTSTLTCVDNIFEGQTSPSSFPIDINAANNVVDLFIKNNIFNSNRTGSISVYLDSVLEANMSVLNNTFTNNQSGNYTALGSNFVIRLPASTTTDNCSIVLRNNYFSKNATNSLYLHTDGEFTNLEVTASSNTMSNNVSSALVLSTPVDTLTLLATGNTITGCSDTGIAVIAAGLTSTENITINNNTITNIGNTQSAIAIAQGSSILNFTAENNTIANCEGSGIVFYSSPSGFGNITANIVGNTINNCQNQGANNGSGISMDTYIDLTSKIVNNNLSNNVSPGVALGNNTNGNPNVCLTLTGNNSDTDPSYFFVNPGSGAFNLAPLNVELVNTGTINPVGTITPVTSCP